MILQNSSRDESLFLVPLGQAVSALLLYVGIILQTGVHKRLIAAYGSRNGCSDFSASLQHLPCGLTAGRPEDPYKQSIMLLLQYDTGYRDQVAV
jgi:hypothetical protein